MNQMGEKKIILCRQTGECGCREVVDVIPWTNHMVQVQSSRDLTFNWPLWAFPFLELDSFIYLFGSIGCSFSIFSAQLTHGEQEGKM